VKRGMQLQCTGCCSLVHKCMAIQETPMCSDCADHAKSCPPALYVRTSPPMLNTRQGVG
jgi:hypothetical protein